MDERRPSDRPAEGTGHHVHAVDDVGYLRASPVPRWQVIAIIVVFVLMFPFIAIVAMTAQMAQTLRR